MEPAGPLAAKPGHPDQGQQQGKDGDRKGHAHEQPSAELEAGPEPAQRPQPQRDQEHQHLEAGQAGQRDGKPGRQEQPPADLRDRTTSSIRKG